MMIKVFTKNSNGKIELDEKELKSILDEAYWEGYGANNTFTYSSPNHSEWQPYCINTASSSSVTIGSSNTEE